MNPLLLALLGQMVVIDLAYALAAYNAATARPIYWANMVVTAA